MRNVVFVVKNGIGFGHIRRALLIAHAVQRAGRVRPIIISQASSLALYRDSRVRVINFPLLHRVPSAITEDFYTDVLDQLLERLDPAVVIEDTYPDARYRRLPALVDRPRLLVMRRLDSLSFDQIRERGDLSHYDHILLAQDEPDFHRERHSGDTLAAVESSGLFSIVGNVAHTPDPADVTSVRRTYGPDGGPLVVVNGGAGGDQMPDGYGDRLFGACQLIAATLAAEGHSARFVFVTGPYYAGRPLHNTSNVIVRRFEPLLSALLAAADVAVIKPGNNALAEALCGRGHLVLVPDVSFMEGLDAHAARVVAAVGGAVSIPDATHLEPLIRNALAAPPRRHTVTPAADSIDTIVSHIHAHADATEPPRVTPKSLLIAFIPPRHVQPADLTCELPDALKNALVVDDEGAEHAIIRLRSITTSTAPLDAVLVDDNPTPHHPDALVERGCRLLIHTGSPATLHRWLRLHPPSRTILTMPAERITAGAAFPTAAARRASRVLAARSTAVLLVDLSRLKDTDTRRLLSDIAEWVAKQPVTVSTIPNLIAEQARLLVQEGAT